MELKIYRSGMACALNMCVGVFRVCAGKEAATACAPMCMHSGYSFVHLHQGVSKSCTHKHIHTDREAEVSSLRGDDMPW